MRLKATCWFFAALTFIMLLGWPVFVGVPPHKAARPVLAEYAHRSEIWFCVLISSFLLATVFAALVVRQTREEYLRDSAANLRLLVEGTLEDHRKRSGSENEPG